MGSLNVVEMVIVGLMPLATAAAATAAAAAAAAAAVPPILLILTLPLPLPLLFLFLGPTGDRSDGRALPRRRTRWRLMRRRQPAIRWVRLKRRHTRQSG